MDWSTVFTILATGAVSLGSVWLKGHFDARTEVKRLEAQRQDAEAARQRQVAQDKEIQESQRNSQGKRNGLEAMGTFTQLLSELSLLPKAVDANAIATKWNTRYDARARAAIELIADADTREDMLRVIPALANLDSYLRVNHLDMNPLWSARELVQVLVELAGAESRGDDRSIGLDQRTQNVRDNVNVMEEHYMDYP